jgi:hypothetical protein
MTLHYHGLPITPNEVLLRLAGCCFCVSHAAPQQVKIAHDIGQSVMLDNGAFSLWKANKPVDWPGFYRWADQWLDYPTTWAVIPDVIDGTDADNDALIGEWPFGDRGAPVWHLHEGIDRLLRLADSFPRICFGSSGEYAEVGTWDWHCRIGEAFNGLSKRHRRLPWIHMLRGMALAGGPYPFASVDSTNIARNHAGNNTRSSSPKDPRRMADMIDARQCPGNWAMRPQQRQGCLLSMLGENYA